MWNLKKAWGLFLLVGIFYLATPILAQQKAKVYLSVFYYGQIALVVDFSNEKMGLMALLDETGKWDLQVKDPKNADIKYVNIDKIQEYMRDKFKGKIAQIGNIKIERYVVDHPVLIAQPSKIGNIPIKYYYGQEDASSRGKVMQVGNLVITYHNYQTLVSYGKIKSINNLRIDYHIKEGVVPKNLLGKVSQIGRIKVIYNKEGEIVRLEGKEKILEIEFWDKAKIEALEKESFSEDELEKELDKATK